MDVRPDLPQRRHGGEFFELVESVLVAPQDRLSDLIVPLTSADESPAARLRLSLQMANDGIQMMRQNLRRRFSRDSDREIDQRLSEWLQGAHDVDGVWLRLAPERLGSL